MMAVMHPSAENSYRIRPELLEQLQLFEAPEKPQSMSPSIRLNWWPGFNLIVGVAGLAWLVGNVVRLGVANAITLNTINFFFLMVGILLHWYPWRFLKAAENAGKVVWGVIIQFPFYAGIFGLFKFTSLATAVHPSLHRHREQKHILADRLLVCRYSELLHSLRWLRMGGYSAIPYTRGKRARC